MNEWGEYTIDADKIICIQSDGAIDAIQNNNPAITSILAEAFDDDSEDEEEGEISRVDWAAAGACLGHSETVKYLELKVNEYESSENIQVFCNGLVLNRSIEHLVIRCGFEEGYNADNGAIERLTDRVFNNLRPFFEHNTQLVSIEIAFLYDDCKFVAGIHEALAKCSTLESVKLRACTSSYQDDVVLEKLIQVISMMRGLRHISLEGCILSKQSCLELKNMICAKECSLSSLKLKHVETNGENVKEIASGLGANNTLKCFNVTTYHEDDDPCPVITSLQNVPTSLSSIEVLDLVGYGIEISASLLKQASNLTSLNLSHCSLPPSQIAALPWTTLKELSIMARSGSVLDELVSNLSTNTQLIMLELHTDYFGSASGWRLFFDSVKTVALMELRLGSVISNNSVMMALCKYLAFNRQLKVLKCNSFRGVTSEGWRTFASTLQSSNIEELAVQRWATDQLVYELAPILKLKRLCLQIDRYESLQLLANSLSHANCQLEELKVSYLPTESDPSMDLFFMNSEAKHALLAMTMVSALERNTTLKVLHVQHSIHSEFDWQSHFYGLVCNVSTIDQTDRSNHTIESLKFSDSYSHGHSTLSVELYSMLHLNSNPEKKTVAREKILRSHEIESINVETPALPHVISCLSSTGTPRLSLVYGILRRMPYVIQNCNKKRKATDIEL